MDLSDLFAAFSDNLAAAFTQERRLLRLDVAGLPPRGLLAWRVRATEAVSADYRLSIDCLSAYGDLELKGLLGRVAELGLLLPDGRERVVSGLVAEAAQEGSDGGFARYRLEVVPGLALLVHRRNSRVFQDLSVPQIVDTLFAEHSARGGPFAAACRWELALSREYPARSYCLQYRESDHDFVHRLLAEEGIATRYEFAAGDDGIPAHTLILFDDPWAAPPCAQPRVRFHRADASEEDDTLTVWHATRRLRAGRSALASYDYKPASSLGAEEASAVDQGDAGEAVERLLDDYDPQTLYYAADGEELAAYARRRQDARDRAAKDYHGESSVRAFAAGRWFELVGHPRHEGRASDEARFLIRELAWEAQNNLPGELQSGLAGLLGLPGRSAEAASQVAAAAAAPPYRNRILAVRRDTPVLPDWQPLPGAAASAAAQTLHRRSLVRPTAPGVQTATVVGPAGEEIHTDALGRIKIRFHWVREADHPDGGAAFDERASCWVRVATPWAGAGFGHLSLPRVGQEVLVGFLEGDIDRPVVVGSLYNGSHPPPAFSGAGSLPANKALAGIKSQELKGRGHNQLLFDDSTGQVRAQLASSHGSSQLNLGYLIHPRRDGEGEARGEGFELRTDQAGAVRAAKGLFLSADAQPKAGGVQLARREALSQLDAALDQANALSQTAARQNAEPAETGDGERDVAGQPKPAGHQTRLVRDVKDWEAGSNTASGSKGGDGSTGAGGGAPILLASAPAGIALATAQSLALASGQNLDQVAGRDTQQTTARRWVHNVGEKISLFVRGVKESAAVKLFAAQGNIDVQAQGGKLDVTGQTRVTLTAINGEQLWAGQKEVLLTCGGGYIRIAGGNIEIHAPGTVAVKGAGHEWGGPGSHNATLPRFAAPLPVGTNFKFNLWLQDIPGDTGSALAHAPWKIATVPAAQVAGLDFLPDDEVIASGISDAEGKLVLSPEQEQRLAEVMAKRPTGMSLTYPGRSVPILIAVDDGQWDDTTKVLNALNAGDFSDDTYAHAHGEQHRNELREARALLGGKSPSAVVDYLKKG